ncbi:MAG TPA: hypothetical protein VHB78_00050 [Vicinamibacterales bacterium]|jgi:hypothetical protein|nr:hypothetical protein [Vicinamibacterales bacterium]
MSNTFRIAFVMVCGLLVGVVPAMAQQPAATPPRDSPTFKVDVVFSRFQGTKRISTMPYSLVVNSSQPGRPNSTNLRVGVDAPTGRAISSTQNGVTTTSPEYKYVGTNIDCWITDRNTPTYEVHLNLQDYSLASQANGDTSTSAPTRFDLAIRNFGVSNTLTMRDGQSVEFSVGTDPVTGETIRASVTIAALK